MKIECPRIFRNISLIPGPAVDGEARVYLQARLGADVRTIAGQIYGPHCEFGRTLASTFVVEAVPGRAGEACLAQSLVLDPCFWTPEMPFLYDLELTIDSTVYKTSMGLRRWSANGASWSLEARRVVLRGAGTTDSSNETLAQARLAETPLLVTLPSEESLARASRSGVPLLVDLRNVSEQLGETLHQLAWHPAVFGVGARSRAIGDALWREIPGLAPGCGGLFSDGGRFIDRPGVRFPCSDSWCRRAPNSEPLQHREACHCDPTRRRLRQLFRGPRWLRSLASNTIARV